MIKTPTYSCLMAALSLALATQLSHAQTADPKAAPSTPPAATAAPPAPPVPIAYNEAVQKAANALMAGVPESLLTTNGSEIAIDPLIDGYTGNQNATTVKMGRDISEVVKQKYTRFKVVPFTADAIAKKPLILVGTFRPVNSKNVATDPKDAYHICLALLDLKSGKVVSKGVARALPAGVDATPTKFFKEAPVWLADASTTSYIKTCQATKVGDQIDAVYADRITVSSTISQAVDAYNRKRYKESLALYKTALGMPGGQQLRVYNGIYLANWRLRHAAEAKSAFGQVVDYGLKSPKLAVNFLFRPSTTNLYSPKGEPTPYAMWIKEISARGAATDACLEIVGHTSKSGPAAVNDRLSVLRAEYIRDRVIGGAPTLSKRTIATGLGAKETIIGTDGDTPENAVDRRVEFKTVKCAT